MLKHDYFQIQGNGMNNLIVFSFCLAAHHYTDRLDKQHPSIWNKNRPLYTLNHNGIVLNTYELVLTKPD